MQPVQDLTVETASAARSISTAWKIPIAQELDDVGAAASSTQLQALPELRDVASDQQNQGLQARVVIDRDTASRLGITPQMIDDALYDAFGQRQISTMFTQLNQYRVVLEVEARVSATTRDDLQNIYVRSAPAATGAAQRVHAHRDERLRR